MSEIHIIAAELSGRFTSRPTRNLKQMMTDAAARALARSGVAPRDVDALFTGAMGSFPPEGFVGPIPIRLANSLGLPHADVTPMQVGSSEAGAWLLRQAYEAMRHTGYDTILVVAGEQMNQLEEQAASTPAAKLEARMARNRAISEIVDDRERLYGLNMVRLGDLTMDVVRLAEGIDKDDVTEVLLPYFALRKYRRVRGYPYAHLHHRADLSLDAYRQTPPLTPYFNLHDVSPTSSGAVALILSRQPRASSLQILGMGQAFVPLSLAGRAGDPRQAGSVRTALARACRDADVNIGWLHACDFALVHDAFISIEYAFLRELGLSPAEIADRIASGWSNPFGGLKTCGHAVGASGLLQVAKAFHRVFLDERYLSEEICETSQRADTCFTTSVGGPLTNIVVTLLKRSGIEADAYEPRGPTVEEYEGTAREVDSAYARFCDTIPEGHGLLLAGTQIRHAAAFGDDTNPLLREHQDPWIYLVEKSPHGFSATDDVSPKAYGFSDAPLPTGSIVRMESVKFCDMRFLKVTPTGRCFDLPGRMSSSNWSRLIASLREDLEP